MKKNGENDTDNGNQVDNFLNDRKDSEKKVIKKCEQIEKNEKSSRTMNTMESSLVMVLSSIPRQRRVIVYTQILDATEAACLFGK